MAGAFAARRAPSIVVIKSLAFGLMRSFDDAACGPRQSSLT
jgi:hypothetical protein